MVLLGALGGLGATYSSGGGARVVRPPSSLLGFPRRKIPVQLAQALQ